MKESLNKIIQTLILPQFPWVKDYEIYSSPENGYDDISIIYTPQTDEDGGFVITDDFKKLEKLTKDVFKKLGLGAKYRLYTVVFKSKDGYTLLGGETF